MSEVPIQRFSTPPFEVDAGMTLPAVVLAYKSYGTASDGVNGKPVILVSTCFGEVLSADNPLIGEGKALDPANYYIIKVGLMGGSDSTSPSNTPAPYSMADFPLTTYSDNVRAQRLLMQNLGVTKLEAVVGFSMGGQIAYTWGVLYPKFVKKLVCLCTSARTSIHNFAFLEGPKGALKASGDYSVGGKGTKAFGRAYCAWAYSHDWFEQKKWEENGFTSLEDFMTKRWQNSTANGYDLLTLATTWQASDISKARLTPTSTAPYKTLEAALGEMRPKVLVMPGRTDQYFVPEDSEHEVKHLRDGTLRVIESIYGHVAGGGGGSKEDIAFIDKEVGEFVRS